MPAETEIDILLVEDNPADARLACEAFKTCGFAHRLHIAGDALQAANLLNRKAVSPGIIILDLNLPGKNGLDFLKELKSSKQLKQIPVIILTTSQSEDDIAKAYALHANAYMVKPQDMNKFSSAIKTFAEFWFSAAKLPPK